MTMNKVVKKREEIEVYEEWTRIDKNNLQVRVYVLDRYGNQIDLRKNIVPESMNVYQI